MNADTTARERTIALGLAGVAGFVDAVGFITLAGLFTAHMSGNAAQFGVAIGHGKVGEAVPLIVAIGLFVIAVAAGALLQELAARTGVRSTLAPMLLVEAALVAALMVYGSAVVGSPETARSFAGFYVTAALAIGAMGLQAASFAQVGGQRVRTAYISGMLTNLGRALVAAMLRSGDAPGGARLSMLAGIVVTYLAGASAGGYVDSVADLWCLALPVAALLGLAWVGWGGSAG
jgi:uncharacterized membrane protein YoaK (UPF0700 family)